MSLTASELALLKSHAVPLHGIPSDFDSMIKTVRERNAEFVLIGEASHGTAEFYRTRAELTKRLVTEEGFTAVCVEADWPDAMRVNRFVKGKSKDRTAEEALKGFERFPQWMWRNTDVLDFVTWLRTHNDSLPAPSRIGFYGMDLYSLHSSSRAVVEYLARVDPRASNLARERYACFDRFGDDTQRYGYLAGLGITEGCQKECLGVVRQMGRERERVLREGEQGVEEAFDAEMNAKVVKDAEEYYRQMFREDVSSWNLRDSHMVDTLFSLQSHLSTPNGPKAKIVVWAHNSHLGDASATSMGARGEHNVGMLVRRAKGEKAVLVGFTTWGGTVTAASNWDAPAELKRVRPGMDGSWELLFHSLSLPTPFLLSSSLPTLKPILSPARWERAIGVIYRPDTEKQSHYFKAKLGSQFDFVIHVDVTNGVVPLEKVGKWTADEVEETFPTGL